MLETRSYDGIETAPVGKFHEVAHHSGRFGSLLHFRGSFESLVRSKGTRVANPQFPEIGSFVHFLHFLPVGPRPRLGHRCPSPDDCSFESTGHLELIYAREETKGDREEKARLPPAELFQ